jgi:enamine deaminase RidA (YjgF/YER057c/UK114 family)
MDRKVVNLPGPAYPGFSRGVKVGRWIHLSGQLGVRDGRIVGHDPGDQAWQCFANIRTVLEQAGASLTDVVKLTCFAVDRSAYSAYAAVKAELFATDAPGGTTVIVAGLLDPRARMEVEAVAYCAAG